MSEQNTEQRFLRFRGTDKFSVGMRVHGVGCDESEWFDVLAVIHGEAACLRWDGNIDWISQKAIDRFVLDLDSIWIGKEYQKKGVDATIQQVEAIGNDFVFLVDRDGNDSTYPLLLFKLRYDPLPFSVHAEQVKPSEYPWKPEAGKECVITDDDGTEVGRGKLVCWHIERQCWVVYHNWQYVGLPAASLRPLPPETPVTVGDIVFVKASNGLEYIGRVLSVNPDDRHFVILEGDSQRMLMWDDGSVITRLVPANEGDKA